MDSASVSDDLAQAEQHVAEGEQDLVRQNERILDLATAGHDTTQAQALLRELQDSQSLRVDTHNRLRGEHEQPAGRIGGPVT